MPIYVNYSKEFKIIQFLLYSGSFVFFHQAPQVEKESGPEEEEEIGDSQEPIYQLSISYGLKKKTTYVQFHFYYHVHGHYINILKSSAIAIFFVV